MEEKPVYELTNPQKMIYLTEQYFQGTTINNICGSLIIRQNTDLKLLNKAINYFIRNNDSFKMHFKIVKGELLQYLTDDKDYEFEIINIKEENEIEERAKRENSIPFNLIDSKLFDFKLFKLLSGNGGFIVKTHHIISDAITLSLVTTEIMKIYSKLIKNEEISYEKYSYIDYINSEKEYNKSLRFEKDKKYWNETLMPLPNKATFLPQKSEIEDISSSREEFTLDKKTIEKIKKYCETYNISMFNFLIGVYSIYIGKINNQEIFTLGTPILNRTNYAEKHTSGMFISTSILKIDLSRNIGFSEFTKEIAKNNISMFKHQKYNYQYILEDIKKKDKTISKLYDIMLSYQITKATDLTLDIPYTTNWYSNNCIVNPLEIHFYDINDTNNLHIAYDYQIAKIAKEEINKMHDRICYIIDQILNIENIFTYDIDIVTKQEKDQILYKFNNDNEYKDSNDMIQNFKYHVLQTPDEIALVFKNKEITYKSLDIMSDNLAHYLYRLDIKEEEKIAIFLDKSIEMIVCMLAILKVHGCYVPIDILYPSERIEYIIKDANIQHILTKSNLTIKLFNTYNAICVDNINLVDSVKFEYKPEKNTKLAYVMYTSGSTGEPKGVTIEQIGILRMVKNPNYMKLGKNEKVLQTGSIVFDASTYEIWTALLNGFSLHILRRDELLNLSFVENYIEKNNISIIFLTTALLNQFSDINPKMFQNAKYLLTGGEACSTKHINKILENCPKLKVINCYGPTENSAFTTCFNINKKYTEKIPIGTPITGTKCMIVSKFGTLQPIKIPGELWVSGQGVSRGYLNKEELTKKNFIKSKFYNNETIYKTGDLVEWLLDGNIDYLGRIDNQVKIHGFRIELDEINNVIMSNNKILNSLTTIITLNNTKIICSYIVLKEKIEIDDIKKYLAKRLPEYMIPKYFTILEEFSLTINGKIDKKALPMPEIKENKEKVVSTQNPIENFLCEKLEEILNINKIYVNDNLLELGFDSLDSIKLSSIVKEKYNVELNISYIIDNPYIYKIANYINSANTRENMQIKKVDIKEYYNASSAQKRIYYASEISGKDSVLYNITGGLYLDKMPDVKKLEKCFNILIDRHEAFRTTFEILNNNLVQRIVDKVNIKIKIIKEEVEDIEVAFKKFSKPFNLSKAPLLRVSIVNLKNDKALLLLDTHHIIMDGTSMQILTQELCKLYNDEELSKLELTYKDFSAWEEDIIKKDELIKSKKFWQKIFKDEIPILNLPLKHPRQADKSYKGAKIYKTIKTELANRIMEISKKYKITPFMIFLSSYYILLSKYTEQDDIIVGTPVIGRDNPKLANIIGMFVNTLPIRAKINSKETFLEFLNNIKDMSIECFENQTYPLNEIIDNLDISRDASRTPLFDVLFTYQNENIVNIKLGDIKAKYLIPDSKIAKFDLSLEVTPKNGQIDINFEYCTNLFTNRFVNVMAKHYLKILSTVVNNVDIEISKIDMLKTNEKRKILNEFNYTGLKIPENKNLIQLFERQVKLHPNNIAVQKEEKSITYFELDKKSNYIANEIIRRKINPNTIIGVYMNKTIELLIAIWGILKAGCIYMPMYVKYPTDRLNYMVDNSNCPLIFTNRKSQKFSVEIFNIPSFEEMKNEELTKQVPIMPNTVAYCIYTSGSTGRPKGAKITHKNLINYIYSFNKLFQKIYVKDRFLSSTNISFDVSIWELFLSILNGATLVLYNEEIIQNIVEYANYIIANEITTLYIPPNILEEVYSILKNEPNVKINKILVGVEPIKRSTLNKYLKLNPKMIIINGYGPTETTICSTALNYKKTIKLEKNVSIGKPIGNTKIYILNKDMNIVPIGVPGEIFITGYGVGSGYINNEEENNKNFIKNIFNNMSEKMYKTGDIAKWNYDGTISYISRKDSQVKISGYRIELKEIDNTLIRHPAIFKCLTTVYKLKNKKYLVTYYTASKKIDRYEVISFLQEKLAFYMVPNIAIQLDAFPLTANGKIDVKKMPKPKINIEENKYIAPKTLIEKTLCKIWKNLFGIEQIGIDDNFFKLGGDSLSAIRMQVDALSKNLNITYSDIFKYPTIRLLAQKANNTICEKEKNTFKNYDYTKINELLNFNDKNNIRNIKSKPIKNVLLTGATGFLGAHILNEYFMSDNIGKIYCFVRNKNNKDSEKRLKDTIRFYFGDKYDNYLGKKIIVVVADMSKNKFGLKEEEYESIAKNIDIVINSAALVKHYGEYNKFYSINVEGTKNIIKFCKKYNKKLYHISTISVSGFGLIENNLQKKDTVTYFNEKDLFKGQNLDNAYIKTKFEAEKIILDEISQGLKATIFRMGNIQNRYSDGKFQINYTENAFVNRIKSVLKLEVLQEGFKKHATEIAPVDLCAKAIISIIKTNPKFSVFHIFNNNLTDFSNLVKYINNQGKKIDFVTDTEFSNKVKLFLKDPNLKNEISGIVADLNEKKEFSLYANILLDTEFSKIYLQKIGFKWPKIDQEYINKYIQYFKDLNYFN